MTLPQDPYNPNVPIANWTYSQWQPSFLNNFQQLYNAFKSNHEPLDAASNIGNHTNVQFYDQLDSPNVVISELGLFAKLVPNQVDQIFMKYQDNKTEFQWTNYQLYVLSPTPRQTPFFTTLPGGVIVYFGTFFRSLTSANTIDLAPYVAKNIISANAYIGSGGGQLGGGYPGVGFEAENGFIKNVSLTFTTIPLVGSTQPIWYIVMANT